VGLSSSAQTTVSQARLDSINTVISNSEGAQKYAATFQAAYDLFDVDNRLAVSYARDAFALASRISDSAAITRSGRLYGQLLRRTDNLEEAERIFLRVLPIAERNSFVDEQKRILNALAVAYNYQASFDKALFYSFKSLEIREREGDLREISVALGNIGVIYYKMGDFEQALDYYGRALIKKNQANDIDRLDQLYINLALCHVYLQNFELAEDYVTQAFSLCKDNCPDELRIVGEFCLGITREAQGEDRVAKAHFNKSHGIASKVGDHRLLAETSLWLGTVSTKLGEVDSAKVYLSDALKVSREFGYNQILVKSYLRFSDLYRSLEDYENASLFQAKYISLHDSIYNQDLIRNVAKVQSNFAERENIKTIAEQDEILRLNQIVIDRQRQVYFFLALIAVLSILIALIFLRYSRALSKAKMELSVANQTLERRVEDRTKALQNVNNELDNFIYKTSHDIRGPLASLKGIANVALLELTDSKAQDYLHKLDASADKLNTILTRLLIVNQINHAVLTNVKIDFPELLQEILTFERKKGVPSRLTISHEIEQGVTLSTDRHVLRIILENLIDNAIKYHNSSDRVEPFVKIKVGMNGEGVKIRVIDNGIGIKESDPQKLFQMFVRASERSESGGIGLYLTKLASERLFAKVDYSTTSEKFTQFTVTLPLDLGSKLAEKDRDAV
jgi:signal transduction histidine kinase/Flp pilus assembly protein TadD